ncbi:hypothetical protein ACTXT7_016959 [Hymenolepis weldensis]
MEHAIIEEEKRSDPRYTQWEHMTLRRLSPKLYNGFFEAASLSILKTFSVEITSEMSRLVACTCTNLPFASLTVKRIPRSA